VGRRVFRISKLLILQGLRRVRVPSAPLVKLLIFLSLVFLKCQLSASSHPCWGDRCASSQRGAKVTDLQREIEKPWGAPGWYRACYELAALIWKTSLIRSPRPSNSLHVVIREATDTGKIGSSVSSIKTRSKAQYPMSPQPLDRT
jgi:hypothetical protein